MAKMRNYLLAIISLLLSLNMILLISCSNNPVESSQTNESETQATTQADPETSRTDDSDATTGIETDTDTETADETTDTQESYVIVPSVTTEVDETTDGETSTEETDALTESGNPSDVSLLSVLKSFNVVTLEYKSLICYNAEKDESGACTIIIAENNKERTEATVTTYLFYENDADFEAAKQIYADPQYRDDARHLVIDSVSQDDPIEKPNDFIFVSLFGYRLFS